MAQYFTDFSEFPVGPLPAELVVKIDTTGDSSFSIQEDGRGKHLEVINPTRSFWAVVWTAHAPASDLELYQDYTRTSNSDEPVRLLLRVDTTSELTWYEANVEDSTIELQVRDDGTTSNLAQQSVNTSGDNSVRASCIGNTIKFSAWNTGDTEPPQPTVETTDATLTQAGFTGIGHFRENETVRIYKWGVGTDGDPAPTEPLSEENGTSNATYTVTGQITTTAGAGIENATLNLTDDGASVGETLSAADGTYSLEVEFGSAQLPKHLVLTADRAGYLLGTHELVLTKSQTTYTTDLVITEPGTLVYPANVFGNLDEGSAGPVDMAEVTIRRQDGSVLAQAVSDQFGNYSADFNAEFDD